MSERPGEVEGDAVPLLEFTADFRGSVPVRLARRLLRSVAKRFCRTASRTCDSGRSRRLRELIQVRERRFAGRFIGWNKSDAAPAGPAKFLSVHEYENVLRWTNAIADRPAVKRGRIVNRTWGAANAQLKDRHSSADIDAVLAKPVEEAAE